MPLARPRPKDDDTPNDKKNIKSDNDDENSSEDNELKNDPLVVRQIRKFMLDHIQKPANYHDIKIDRVNTANYRANILVKYIEKKGDFFPTTHYDRSFYVTVTDGGELLFEPSLN